MDAGETFQTCISRTRNPLRQRLSSVRPDIEAAAFDYAEKADSGDLHLISTATIVGGCVKKKEMVKVYDYRMARKNAPGRALYDQIKLLPKDDRCPICDQRSVSTLDHVLPKTLYPALAVAPDNLHGACLECNITKSSKAPTSPQDTALHPYFDDISQEQWLRARVVQQDPYQCALVFSSVPPPSWSAVLGDRVRHQFELFNLSSLYSSEAAREMSNIRLTLQSYFDTSGPDEVRKELLRQWESRRSCRLNSWQTATYEALAHDAWFCEGGFACGH